MPYQNNNNRITPQAVEDRSIKPAATPADKMIHYSIDTNKANKWAGTANALASLGKGLMEMDVLWRYEAQENAIQARWEAEQAGENKNAWADVSKHIHGAGIFNPYNDDAFRNLQAQDIYRAAALEIAGYPDLEKLDEQSFNQLVQDTNTKMFQAFKETGLSPKDYGTAVMQWNHQIDDLNYNYVIKNKEYLYKQLQTKETADLTFNIETALAQAEDTAKAPVFRQTIEDKLSHLSNETGIVAPDVQANIVLGSVANVIARNTNQIDDAEILAAVADLKLGNGQSLSEVVPNYDIKIKDLCIQAREASYRQMRMELEIKQAHQEQILREGYTDAVNQMRAGKLKSPQDIFDYANSFCNDHPDLDGTYQMKFWKMLKEGQKTIADVTNIESDPETLQKLGIGVITGKTSGEEIAKAMYEGKISFHDGMNLEQHLVTQEQRQEAQAQKLEQQARIADSKRVQAHIKSAEQEYCYGIKQGDMYQPAILQDPEAQTAFRSKVQQLKTQYDQDGDYNRFNNELAKWKSGFKQYTDENNNSKKLTGALRGYEKWSNSPRVSHAQYQAVNFVKDNGSLKSLGLIRQGLNTSITISSLPQENRKITITSNGKPTTVARPHKGYDVGGKSIYIGQQVHAPLNGKVVNVTTAAKSGGYGNLVTIAFDNGTYMRVAHLESAQLPPLGAKLKKGDVLGLVGNTGAVENKKAGSLHVEFYDKNGDWITVTQFAKMR